MPFEYDLIVPAGKQRERLDIYLTHHVENATRAKVQQAIKDGAVTVDGGIVKPSYKVSPGETIHIVLPGRQPTDAQPEELPLDIVYEDDYLIVLNKAAGMVTHPAYANYDGTLVNALLFHSKGKLSLLNASSTETAPFPRPGIVHRLDKDTSGLMVVAKDDVTHAVLSRQFSQRTIIREYWAVVWGTFPGVKKGYKKPEVLTVEAPLGRSPSDRKKIAVVQSGKPAITDYSVLEEFAFLSLVRCKLRTGRTHQIRVHLSHIGHPVFGDGTYGGRKASWGGLDGTRERQAEKLLELMPRQALHAKTIGFVHPKTGELMTFDSQLPPDFESVLSFLKSKRRS